MITFPNVTIRLLETKDSFTGQETQYANLPCLICMFRGEFDRHQPARRATELVEISDLMRIPCCRAHAADFEGDKR